VVFAAVAVLGAGPAAAQVHVPDKGETPAITEAISGQVAMLFATSVGVAGRLKSGRLRLLATCGEERAKAFPATPMMIEARLPGGGDRLGRVPRPGGHPARDHRESAAEYRAPARACSPQGVLLVHQPCRELPAPRSGRKGL